MGLAALTAAMLLGASQSARAGVFVGVGGGGCWHPGFRVGVGVYFPGYYYPGYPYYVAPAPVIVQPAPVVVQQAPTVVQPAYPAAPNQTPEKIPAPSLKPATSDEPPIATTVSAPGAGVNATLARLSGADARDRAEAAIELGRLKERQAIEPLSRALKGDASPAVREAAARALGLIADPASLNALQYAAQADDDRDVRHSAQFAAEIIRGNLRR
jgi:hypothetical protein